MKKQHWSLNDFKVELNEELLLTLSMVSTAESLAGEHAWWKCGHLSAWPRYTTGCANSMECCGCQRTERRWPNRYMTAECGLCRHQHLPWFFNFTAVWRRHAILIPNIFDVNNGIVIIVGIWIIFNVRFRRCRTVRCVSLIFCRRTGCATWILLLVLMMLLRMLVMLMVLLMLVVVSLMQEGASLQRCYR